jgi:hypothetical protein
MNSRTGASWPWIVLLVLLTVCLAHGLWVVRGLGSYAAILDAYRDAGFVQGFLDGNLGGDPSIDGAKRYYPPLLHALAAGAAFITQSRPLDFLVRAAPWLNLLVPVTFFLMVRRLVNAPAAAIAAILFVCFDGLLLPPWMAASYTPWHSVPAFTQALFFCSVWLISARVQHGRFIDALTIGSAIGLVFLAHTVPALILAAITAAAAVTTRGFRVATIVWLVVVAVVTTLWALPFVLPLVTTYHMKIVNASGSFIDPMFDPGHIPTRVVVSCLPGLGALAWLGWRVLARPGANAVGLAVGSAVGSAAAAGPALGTATLTILSVWIVLPALFIVRHFGCGGGGTSAVCTGFVVPVHHWLFYLQSALACVFGYAAMAIVCGATAGQASAPAGESALAGGSALARERALATGSTLAARPAVVLGVALVVGCALLMIRPMDRQMRERALDMRNRLDVSLYQWLLANTLPSALFITDISTNAVHDTAAIAVLAAGRKSVALPFTFSNPYVEWETRKQREEAYLAAARSGADKSTLCKALTEAGHGNALYIALAKASDVAAAAGSATNPPADQLRLAFSSAQNNLYQVLPSVCN